MIEQNVAITNNVIDSLVESQRQSFLSKGIDLGSSWVETQKTIWQNAVKSGQCTLTDLQNMIFKSK